MAQKRRMGRDPDRYIEELAALYAEEKRNELLVQFWDGPCGASGSPIERLLAAAMAYLAVSPEHYGNNHVGITVHMYPTSVQGVVVGAKDERDGGHTSGYEVWAQEKVGKYTADFLIKYAHWKSPVVVWAAVECDGHDYHERTEKQARHDKERDRFFQERGLSVLRFTGSQITRDPVKAALEALNSIEKIAETRG